MQILFKKTEDELTGRNIADVFPSVVNTVLYETINRSLSTGETGHSEEYYKTLDKWFEVYCYPSEYGLAVYVNDITTRRKSEVSLRTLNSASEILASTYDLEEGVDKVSKLIVPAFADSFTIDVLRNKKVQPLKVAHADPAKAK